MCVSLHCKTGADLPYLLDSVLRVPTGWWGRFGAALKKPARWRAVQLRKSGFCRLKHPDRVNAAKARYAYLRK